MIKSTLKEEKSLKGGHCRRLVGCTMCVCVCMYVCVCMCDRFGELKNIRGKKGMIVVDGKVQGNPSPEFCSMYLDAVTYQELK